MAKQSLREQYAAVARTPCNLRALLQKMNRAGASNTQFVLSMLVQTPCEVTVGEYRQDRMIHVRNPAPWQILGRRVVTDRVPPSTVVQAVLALNSRMRAKGLPYLAWYSCRIGRRSRAVEVPVPFTAGLVDSRCPLLKIPASFVRAG